MALVAPVLDRFQVFLLSQVLILGMFAFAYNLVFGYAGLASLGHSAFFGLGGYTIAIGLVHLHAPYTALLAAAVLIGAGMGAVFALVTMRARGLYVLLLTLTAAQALWGLAFNLGGVTGGDQGLSGFGRPTLLGFPLWNNYAFFYFCLIFFAIAVFLMCLIVESPFGLSAVGMRESETRLASLGYSVASIRVVMFTFSGLFSGLAGAIFATSNTLVEPSMLYWTTSANVMLMTLVGGAGTLLGPLVGAAVVVVLQHEISTYTERWQLILGGIYVLTVLFARGGIVGEIENAYGRMRRRRRGLPLPAEEGANAGRALFGAEGGPR